MGFYPGPARRSGADAALCVPDFRYSDSTFTFTYTGGAKRYFFQIVPVCKTSINLWYATKAMG
uniref:Uncharacterized protein n=1 Tax=Nothoprocta perdicaria TaxID=30464 RepID=A0A8C6YNQ2_NOTPE